jgi:hypothetical protein
MLKHDSPQAISPHIRTDEETATQASEEKSTTLTTRTEAEKLPVPA